jgi:PAS domain S-box-containing protein
MTDLNVVKNISDEFMESDTSHGFSEKELRIYEHIFSIIDDRLALVDRSYVYLAANSSYIRAHNKSRSEVIGHAIPEVFGNEVFTEIIKPKLDKCLAGERVRYQLWFNLPGLGWRYFDVIYYPFCEQNSTVSGAIVSSRDITAHKLEEEAKIEQAASAVRAEELQKSRLRMVHMQESLRKEIAEQLHGTVQNRLIALSHRLGELEQMTSARNLSAELQELRNRLRELIDGTIHSISHRLYPPILRQGLIPAIQFLADQFEEYLNIKTELDKELQQREKANRKLISEDLRLAAYRITEEALTNVVKHAKANTVTITLDKPPEAGLSLTILDDGQGFDAENIPYGLGISIMRDYAELNGGQFEIKGVPGAGTKVTVILPFEEPAAENREKDQISE